LELTHEIISDMLGVPMTSIPWTGWVLSSLERTSSAGGQLEQPSDVNSSTTTAVSLGPTDFAASVSVEGVADEP
jgi:hypothetical protein